jgi:hypothetical protein
MYQDRTFNLIKGQELTFDLNQIYVYGYEPLLDFYLDYEVNYVVGAMYEGNTPSQLPNWLTITQTQNINTLNYPLSYDAAQYPESLQNGTDYIKECKIKIDTAGTYFLKLVGFFFKNDLTRGRFIGNGWTLNVVEPPPPLVYNNAGIVYNKYDRVIRVEKNKTTQVSFGSDGLFPNGEQLIINSTLPAWITNNTIGLYTQYWSLSPTSTGTYYYNASAYLRNSFQGAASITVIVVDSLYEEIDNCCSDENVNIVWLNRQGGRGNFIFTQRKDFNVEIGKKSTYLTNDIKRYSEIKNVHNGFKVYATGITKNQIDFLDTLRYSIQCWQFVNGVFIPLILDIGSFEKYNTKENMYEISMNFLYAERLNIQRQ